MKLDRYVASEVIVPASLGFVTYTFLLMMRGLFALIEQIFVRGLPVLDALMVLAITLPHVVVLTIPMGFLFGVLLAAGRLSTDNEIVAIQASGISVRRLLRPILVLGVLLAILNGYLFLVVIPKSNRSLKDLRVRLFASARNLGRIQPGVFYEDFPNILLYLRDVDPQTTEWDRVLVYDSRKPGEESLTLARKGRVMTTAGQTLPAGEAAVDGQNSGSKVADSAAKAWIQLDDAVTHQFLREKPDTYRVNANQQLLFTPDVQDRGSTRYALAMRERDTLELVDFLWMGQLAGADGDPEEMEKLTRAAKVELNRRISVPSACIVFALLALPLGIGSRSGGRGRGFVLSVGVVLVYYVIGNNAEIAATQGKLPVWLGMWLPNLVLVLLSVFLMTRMGRWLGERQRREGPISRIRRWWRRRQMEREAARAAPGHDRPTAPTARAEASTRRIAFRFPALLDRYLTVRLLAPLLLVVASTGGLYIVVDLTENINAMAKNSPPFNVIVAYYWNLMPQMIVDVLPFAMLIAVLIVLTVLERQRELTALKGGGISLFRVMIPVVLVASTMGITMWLLAEHVVPEANREKDRLLDIIEGNVAARSYQATDRQWLLSRDDTTFYNFLRYDADSQTLLRFTMYRVDDDMKLRFHLYAPRVQFLDGKWIADGGWFRQFFPDGTDEFRRISKPLELTVPEGPAYFGQEYSSPSEMSFGELRQYIGELEESGYQPNGLIVRWHQKLSYPISAVIMICLALPFGLNRGGKRVTTMQGVALALGLGFGYSILVTVFGELGEAAVLPPAIAAWAPVLLGFLFAVNRATTLRT